MVPLPRTAGEFAPRYQPPIPRRARGRPGLWQLLSTLRRNPLECWRQEHFEEPLVWETLPFGRVAVVNEPDAIRRVLMDNAVNYRKDSLQRRVLSAGLGDGLLSVEGDRWRMQRRTLAPLFAHRAVANFAPNMAEAADALVQRWQRMDGHVLDVAAEMTGATLNVLQHTIFPKGLGRDTEEFRRAMAVYFKTIGHIGALDILGVPNFIPRPAQLRARSVLRFFDRAIDQMIAELSIPTTRRSDAPNDLLTLLLEARDPDTGEPMPDTEVRSNLLTFISAGHETTANALTWSLFLLSQASDWRRRVEDEVLTVGDSLPRAVDRLVLTRAVIEEAIRLYPPIAALSRVAGNEDRLVGETVEAGTLIVIAPFVLHRHRIHWSDPDVFNPARFLPSVRGRINRFTYLPFGAGARTCIGSTFALQEAVIVLASIVQHFEFALATQRVRPTLRVTLRPADGLPMLIRRRHEVVNQLVTSGSGRLTASLGSRPDTSRAADFGRPS